MHDDGPMEGPETVTEPVASPNKSSTRARGDYGKTRQRLDQIEDWMFGDPDKGVPAAVDTRIVHLLRQTHGIGSQTAWRLLARAKARIRRGTGKRTPETYIERLWESADRSANRGQTGAEVQAIKAAAEIEPGREFDHVRKTNNTNIQINNGQPSAIAQLSPELQRFIDEGLALGIDPDRVMAMVRLQVAKPIPPGPTEPQVMAPADGVPALPAVAPIDASADQSAPGDTPARGD